MMSRFIKILKQELIGLFLLQKSDRTWELPLTAALATSLPIFLAIYFGHIEYGLISSLGGMIFLYTPNNTPLHYRFLTMTCATVGISFSYLVGLLSHSLELPLFIVFSLMTFAILVICRFFRVGPPSGLFFIIALSVGTNSNIAISQIPFNVGMMFFGALFASFLAMIYSVFMLHKKKEKLSTPSFNYDFSYVISESIIIALFVGIAVFFSKIFELKNYYWVSVSCLIVLQQTNFRDVFSKILHRVLGTMIGGGVTVLILSQLLNGWGIAIAVMLLMFIVEYFITRNYALAVIFITLLTILQAEANTLILESANFDLYSIAFTRFIDVLLGCFIGLVGGYIIHNRMS